MRQAVLVGVVGLVAVVAVSVSLAGHRAAAGTAPREIPARLPAPVAWYRQYPSAPGSPVTVACPDARVCYAAGTNGAVLRTRDAGRTWQEFRAPVPTGFAIRDIACSTATSCLALADGQGAGGEIQTVLLATADSGGTWTRRHTAAAGGTSGLACPAAAACDVLLRDRFATVRPNGTGWHEHEIPLPTSAMYIDGLACPSSPTCYVDAHESRSDGYGAVLATSDGGLTWRTHIIEPNETHGIFMGIACAGLQTCYVVSNGRSSGVLVTHDAWLTQAFHRITVTLPSSGPESGYFTQPVCPDGQTCYLRSTVGTIAVTTDGGQTWRERSLDSQNPPSALAYLLPSGVSGMTCPATRQCVAVQANGNLDQTTDGWTSWSTVFIGTARTLSSVACTAASTCVALGPDATLLATGNGSTWSRRPYPLARNHGSLIAVACHGPSLCVAVGTNGAVARTRNNGASWAQARLSVPGASQVHLQAASCPTASTCYVGGYAFSSASAPAQAVLYRTRNAGGAWQRLSLPGKTWTINAVACASATVCLAGGGNASDDDSYPAGSLLLTRDGGSTWQQIGTDAYFGMTCEASTCQVVGQSSNRAPLALEVTLAGKVVATWQDRDSRFFRDSLNGVGCVGQTSCFAVGDAGLVAHTVDGMHWVATALTVPQLTALACAGAGRCYAAGSDSSILTSGAARSGGPIVPTAAPPRANAGGPQPTATPLPAALPTPTEIQAGPGCPPTCTPGMVLYRADWSHGFDGWTTSGGGHDGWAVKGNSLISPAITYQQPSTPIQPPFQPGPRGIADYAVQFQVRGDGFHVSIRRDGKRYDDFAMSGCCGNSTSLSIIYRDERSATRGTDSIIGDAHLAPLSPGWHTYRLEVRGEALSFSMDGRVLIRGLDRHLLAGGRIDLSGQDEPVAFRHFEIVAQ